MSQLSTNFTETLSSDNIKNITEDLINVLDCTISAFTEFPFIDYFLKAPKAIISVSDRIFIRKALKFFSDVKDIPQEERYNFIGELEARGKDTAGDLLLSLINRLDNIHKVTIVTNLFRAKVLKDITIDDFIRLSSILERIPIVDLYNLEKFISPAYIVGVSEVLYASGTIRLCKIGDDDNPGDEYVLTEIGANLLKHGLKYQEPIICYKRNVHITQLDWKNVNSKEK